MKEVSKLLRRAVNSTIIGSISTGLYGSEGSITANIAHLLGHSSPHDTGELTTQTWRSKWAVVEHRVFTCNEKACKADGPAQTLEDTCTHVPFSIMQHAIRQAASDDDSSCDGIDAATMVDRHLSGIEFVRDSFQYCARCQGPMERSFAQEPDMPQLLFIELEGNNPKKTIRVHTTQTTIASVHYRYMPMRPP